MGWPRGVVIFSIFLFWVGGEWEMDGLEEVVLGFVIGVGDVVENENGEVWVMTLASGD